MKISSLQKGLVGHWTMAQDSLKGSLLADKTPYENDGTIYGATFATDRKGKANSAMSFNGNDYIDCGDSVGILSSLTISVWVKSVIGSSNIFNNHYHFPAGNNILLHFNGAGFYLQADDGTASGYLAWNNSLKTNMWYNLVGTWDGSIMKLYINGVAQPSTLSFSGGTNSRLNGGLNIGRYFNSGQPGFKGLIDDVRLYNRALSQTEITLLYNSYNPKIQL